MANSLLDPSIECLNNGDKPTCMPDRCGSSVVHYKTFVPECEVEMHSAPAVEWMQTYQVETMSELNQTQTNTGMCDNWGLCRDEGIYARYRSWPLPHLSACSARSHPIEATLPPSSTQTLAVTMKFAIALACLAGAVASSPVSTCSDRDRICLHIPSHATP